MTLMMMIVLKNIITKNAIFLPIKNVMMNVGFLLEKNVMANLTHHLKRSAAKIVDVLLIMSAMNATMNELELIQLALNVIHQATNHSEANAKLKASLLSKKRAAIPLINHLAKNVVAMVSHLGKSAAIISLAVALIHGMVLTKVADLSNIIYSRQTNLLRLS